MWVHNCITLFQPLSNHRPIDKRRPCQIPTHWIQSRAASFSRLNRQWQQRRTSEIEPHVDEYSPASAAPCHHGDHPLLPLLATYPSHTHTPDRTSLSKDASWLRGCSHPGSEFLLLTSDASELKFVLIPRLTSRNCW